MMKTRLPNKNNMIKLMALMLICTAFYACEEKKGSNTDPNNPEKNPPVSESTAAQLTTNLMVTPNAGLVQQLENSVISIFLANPQCGVADSVSLSGASQAGAIPGFSFKIKWNYLLNCVPPPAVLNLAFKGESTFDTQAMSGKNTDSGTVSVVHDASRNFLVKTTGVVSGVENTKTTPVNTVNATLTIVTSSITISSTTAQILSGDATVKLTGSNSGGNFSYSGTIKFLGNNQATLTLDSGKSYPITWS
jgi:hypothetical protein